MGAGAEDCITSADRLWRTELVSRPRRRPTRRRASPAPLSRPGPVLCVCLFITAVPIIKLFARGEGDSCAREEPGTLTQGGALFSLVPLVWESNPPGWLVQAQPPDHRGI